MPEFDPQHPTFYGESYILWDALNVTGSAITDGGASMYYLNRDTQSQTLTAGDSIIVDANPRARQLTANDDAVISWVIETDDGSNGRLALRAGKDPDWAPNPALAGEDLGTVAVTGRETIVLKQTTFTVADIFTAPWPAPILLVEVLSGSVDIRQIRLRVWPPGGALGAWAPQPGYEYEVQNINPPLAMNRGLNGVGEQGDPAGAWGPLISELNGLSGVSEWFPGNASETNLILNWDEHGGTGYFSWGWFGELYIHWEPGETGGNWCHPDIIREDLGAWGRNLAGDPLMTELREWVSGVGGFPGHFYSVTPVEEGPRYVEWRNGGAVYEREIISPGGMTWLPVPPDGQLRLPPAQKMILASVPSSYFTPAGPAVEAVGINATRVTVRVGVPDHLVWDPALAPEKKPRFFVKDHDGNWRAIGPGKAATDPAIFKVRTPSGWYREPRHGEDVTGTGAHPLKVKVRDGTGPDVWDTVVWLTPLD